MPGRGRAWRWADRRGVQPSHEEGSGGRGRALSGQRGLDRSPGTLARVFAKAASRHTWEMSLTLESGLAGAAADSAPGGRAVLCQSLSLLENERRVVE